LRTPARTARPDKGWPRKAITRPRHYHALAAFAAQAKTDFDHGENSDAFGVAQDTLRDSLFRHFVKVAKDPRGLVDDLLLGGRIRGGKRQKAKGEQGAKSLHGYN
jgi:hypothetical protein